MFHPFQHRFLPLKYRFQSSRAFFYIEAAVESIFFYQDIFTKVESQMLTFRPIVNVAIKCLLISIVTRTASRTKFKVMKLT